MALHLENPELEALAAEVAALANESETEAIRTALIERRSRLAEHGRIDDLGRTRSERAADILEQIWATIPPHVMGRRLTADEEDEILGFGAGGV